MILKLPLCTTSKAHIKWIKNWLTDGSQKEVVSGESSSGVGFSGGILQGSVLGLMLFINDAEVNIKALLIKCVDATKVGGEVINEVRAVVQSNLDHFVSWTYSNKCILTQPNARSYILEQGVQAIPAEWGPVSWKVVTEKYLGLIVDKQFNMKSQCDVAKRANRIHGCINREVASRVDR